MLRVARSNHEEVRGRPDALVLGKRERECLYAVVAAALAEKLG